MTAPLPPSLAQPPIGDGSFPVGTPIAIATADGAPREMPVESLARGETVLTLSGPVPVRHVATARLDPPGPGAVPRARLMPVRVCAGAFGEGQPVSDLLLPQESLVHVLDATLPHGALVPLGALVNGDSIRREPPGAAIDWVRLELERPGVVIAAGLLVAARIDPSAPMPAALLPAGPTTVGLRQRLARGAEPTPAPPTTPAASPAPEPAPVMVIAAPEPEIPAGPAPAPAPAPLLGAMVQDSALPAQHDSSELAWHFILPAGTTQLRLVSPRGVPANVTEAERPLARRYGVAIRTLHLDDEPLPLDGPAIGDGFHALESAGSESWRWTTGEAVLTLAPAAGPRRLSVHITDWHRLLQPDTP